MASIDKAAIGFTIAIVAIGAGIAFYGESAQDTTVTSQPPATPTVEPTMTDPDDMNMPEGMAMQDEPEPQDAEMTEPMMEDDAMMEKEEESMMENEDAMMEENEEPMMEDDAMMEKEEEPMIPDEVQAMQANIVDMPVGTAVPGCETTNECYIPAVISVNVGDTVEWINSDTAAHTVTSGTPSDGPSGEFDSSLVLADASFAFTFEEAGSYDYFCLVHPWMSGIVQVN